ADTGVDDDARGRDAGHGRLADALAQLSCDLTGCPAVLRVRVHVAGMTAPVADGEVGAGLGDGRAHVRVGEAAGDVVDDAGAGADGCRRRRRVESVDTHGNASGCELLDHRDHALLLDGRVDPLGSGAGGLAADVEHGGPGIPQRQTVRDGPLRIEVPAAVAERVGGDVDDAPDAGHAVVPPINVISSARATGSW